MGLIVRFGDPDSPLYEFRKKEIVSVTDNKNVNLIGEELSIDTLTPVVRFTVIHPDPLIDSEGVPLVDANGEPLVGYGTGDIRVMPHGTKATLYEVYGDEENLKAVYYVDDVERIAKDQYQINCMSIIGRLEEQKFVGRRFINDTVPGAISVILGNTLPGTMSISPYLQSQRVNGFIPNCTCREALYHLMLSYGIGIYNDRGTLIFRPVGEVGNAEVIPDDRVYIGGKVTYPKPPSSVQVTAHDYAFYAEPSQNYEEHVVFDNTQTLEPANNELITVDFLYSTYRIESLSDTEYEPLWTDFDEGILYPIYSPGQFYIHRGIGKLILLSPPQIDTIYEITNPDAEVERVVSITDELMISPYNAPNAARRMMDYYKNGKIIEQAIILDDEICGNMYELNNAFGEHESAAIMTSMQMVYSGVNKAVCRLVAGTNPAIDFPYTHYLQFDESQTIDLTPIKEQGITEIAVLMIGGGQAGFDGQNGGTPGTDVGNDFIIHGGKGGKGGKGGNGGKAVMETIDITDIDELILTVGEGGSADGEEGEETSIQYMSGGLTITTDTSGGDTFSTGTLNPLSGESYGVKGQEGVTGGDGGNGGRIFAAKILNPDWSYGGVDANGLPIDVSETVAAQPGQKPKVGNAAGSFFPGNPSQGNYGTNLIMYYGSTNDYDIYYSFHGAGGGGCAYGGYIGAAENGEAVYG